MEKFKINQSLDKCCILLFHGVANYVKNPLSNSITNYNNKHISVEKFEEYISYITKYKNVISINDFLDIHYSRKELIPNSCVVTFDDGFRNNFVNAAPILEKYKCPAIFYISTNIVGSNDFFWVDKLEIAFSKTKKNFIKLKKIFNLNKNQENNITPEFYYLYSNKFDLRFVNIRVYLLEQIKKFLKLVDKHSRDKIIINLLDFLISDELYKLDHWEEYKTMSWDQIKNLSNNKLFEIGGHSSSHDILSKHNLFDLEKDIKESIDKIKKELGFFSGHYAYPEGQKEHYSNQVIRLLKKQGVICCPSAIHGKSSFKDDLFHLKRIMIDFNNVNSISNLINF